ncbi:MAG: hypothetical protein NVS2B14_02520 [Chamaesiphon sp.]
MDRSIENLEREYISDMPQVFFGYPSNSPMHPQSSLTVFMGLQPHELEGRIAESVLERSPLPILRGIHQMDLVPSNLTLSAADMRLATAIAKETRLKKALASVEQNYNFVLVDCPPTLGVL